jgi:invasion protein IalB
VASTRTITRRRALAVIVAVAMGTALVPSAFADVGVQGGSYSGATSPTGMKPQSKLWYHDGSWWGVLFSAGSSSFEIYKYNRNAWSWSTTGEVVDDRPSAKVDALWDGSELLVAAAVQGSVPDKRSYLHRFSYNGSTFVRIGSQVEIQNSPIEEMVLAKDSTGVLWANWTDTVGTVWVTHSAGSPHTTWVAPYALASGLLPGEQGDSASIVAFDGKIGVMWSNNAEGAEKGFHFAVHGDGLGDSVNPDPLLSDWTFEMALSGADQGDDHMNLKTLPSGEVLAAVKHEVLNPDEPLISVLRRRVDGTWTKHPVWLQSSHGTRPIMLVDTSAGRVHVFMAHFNRGIVYHKDAPLSTLAFTPSDFGSEFISLSTDVGLNNPTSTRQNVTSSTGLLVMAGDDTTSRYGFNYLTLGGPAVVPAWPTGVTATAGASSAGVTWSAPGNDGGSPITGYKVTPYVNGVARTPTVFNSAATTQTVTGLVNGTTYTFRVQATNTNTNTVAVEFGPASAPSLPVTPATVPGAPTGVTAVPGNASATVTWLPPTSDGGSPITGYTVTSSPAGATITVGTATSAVLTGLTNGTSYTFTVRARNALGFGLPSPPSLPVTPVGSPGAPTGATAVPGNTSATVSWVPPASNGGSPITSYKVTSSPGGRTATVAGATTSAAVIGLTNGTSYTFTVTATNVAGTSVPSAPSNPVVPRTVPGAPRSVAAVPGNTSATVTWLPPTSDGGSAITGYTVTASPGGHTATEAGTATSAVVTGLTNGTSYTFTVTATNVAGDGAPSVPSNPVVPRTVPGAPRSVAAVPGNTSATVTWLPPTSDGGSAITGYTVTASPGGRTAAVAGTATSAAVTGLTNGTAYTFTVTATNEAGTSAASPASNAVVPRTVPGAPRSADAVAGNASATVTWLPPISDGGAPITGYTVTASPGGRTAAVAGTATSAVVTGLTNGTAYTFTVTATNEAGTSIPSTPSNSVVPRTVPAAPTAVAAVPGDASATVTWDEPVSDGGAPITGYVVSWAVNGTVQSATTFASTATAETITGLNNGTRYTFTVAAVNMVGTGSASPTPAAATPRTLPGPATGVTALGGDASAAVSWQAPADNGGSPITGYVVTPYLNGVTQTPRIFDSPATSQTVGGLANEVNYTFTVKAVNVAGTGPASAPSAPVATHHPVGYWMLGSEGVVYSFGDAQDRGEPGAALGGIAAVDIEPDPAGDGYWVVDEMGRVYAYDAPHLGNVDTSRLSRNEKVTSLSATPAGDGYWIFTTRGRVLGFGTARSYGDLLDLTLNGPVLDSIATPSGKGYYMVASDGGVFAFGDARFHGSMGGVRLNAPVQSLVPDPDGAGYWLVASDGGVFAFQAPFRGSMGSTPLNRPVTGMVPYGNGYLMVGEDGGIFSFSDMPFRGSLGANPPARPIVSVAALG